MWSNEAEARRAAELAEQRQRLERLSANAGGGSMITSKSLATNDDDEALKRFNVILKARLQDSGLNLNTSMISSEGPVHE